MVTTASSLLHTPFHSFHVEHGAKLVDFAGWEMPLLYKSIIDEHKQVRTSGGLFDVSHMGRVRFTGKDARLFLDHICTRQIHGMTDGAVRYSLVCNEQGGCRDDVLVYRIAEAEYLMVCNASNRAKLLAHFEAVRGDMVFKIKDETESTAMVALQGPKVMDLLAPFSSEIASLKRYRFITKNLLIAKVMISRTGYTGEDGVEVILPSMFAGQAVKMMLSRMPGDINAPDAPVKPAGLGARDSLRLEAGMPLYGHEITEEIDPISAGLNFAVKLDKGDDDPTIGRFIGQDALQRIAAQGPSRKLVGLVLNGKRSARQGMKVKSGDREIGFVTSGCASPTLGKCIAMAYVDAEKSDVGTVVQVDLERSIDDAQLVALPFYKAG
ncbi:MAG TPA: glycine cleavage system aminomethyltransferase GcvT [Phycisphaerales bacterium]|nr:glycine cleavage system aminomethyltransferase GcvT [Phycisphaerales bacterium]HRQ76673.1 glycine cleavage system aminomethyltransferase GcvT [Phycisphaerales bacterium]